MGIINCTEFRFAGVVRDHYNERYQMIVISEEQLHRVFQREYPGDLDYVGQAKEELPPGYEAFKKKMGISDDQWDAMPNA